MGEQQNNLFKQTIKNGEKCYEGRDHGAMIENKR